MQNIQLVPVTVTTASITTQKLIDKQVQQKIADVWGNVLVLHIHHQHQKQNKHDITMGAKLQA